jgi:hypothetical protein
MYACNPLNHQLCEPRNRSHYTPPPIPMSNYVSTHQAGSCELHKIYWLHDDQSNVEPTTQFLSAPCMHTIHQLCEPRNRLHSTSMHGHSWTTHVEDKNKKKINAIFWWMTNSCFHLVLLIMRP